MESKKYISTTAAAAKWDMSPRQVRNCYHAGRIPDTIKDKKQIMIPIDAENPRARKKAKKSTRQEIEPEMNRELEQLIHDRIIADCKKSADYINESFIANDAYNCAKNTFINYGEKWELICHAFAAKPTADKKKMIAEDCWVSFSEIRSVLFIAGYCQTLKAINKIGFDALPTDYGELFKAVYHNLCNDMRLLPFRKKEKNISFTKIPAASPENIPELYKKLLELCAAPDSVIHPLDRIAESFLMFMTVSPFPEYNFGFGCILMNIELIRNNMLPISFDGDRATRTALCEAIKEYLGSKDSCGNGKYKKMYDLIYSKLEEAAQKKKKRKKV